jgi:glutamyl-tRNA synthetase
MDWGNAYIRDIETKSDGAILSITAQLHLEGDITTTEKKITWVANVPESLSPLKPIAISTDFSQSVAGPLKVETADLSVFSSKPSL